MSGAGTWYSIKQVADLTGMSAQVIRKWEQRYGAVTPERLENGYRVYSQSDVDILKQIQVLVHQGYSVKNAVLALRDGLRVEDVAQVDALNHLALPLHSQAESSDVKALARTFVETLLDAGRRSDTREMSDQLQKVYAMYGIGFCVYQVMLPFLRSVGALWETGEWNESQEHIASQAIRDMLVKFRAEVQVSAVGGPLLLATCVPGERHDIMLQVILLEASLRGWQTAFLGADPAGNALADALKRLQPKVVVASVSTQTPMMNHPSLYEDLREIADQYQEIQFYIGGPGVPENLRTDIYHDKGNGLQYVSSVFHLFQALFSE